MEKLTEEIKQNRKPGYGINPLILGRWSPRSMTGEEISDEELMSLFEAARWAPSSYNGQPWRFIYAKRDTKEWDKLFNLLVEGNQGWAKNAAVLVVIISRKNFEFNNKPSITHTFDTGSSWENMAIEASARGLVTHGMEGFNYDKAKTDLEIPDDYEVCAMVAIGKKGKKEDLPEALQKMEVPSSRKPLKELVMLGKFKG